MQPAEKLGAQMVKSSKVTQVLQASHTDSFFFFYFCFFLFGFLAVSFGLVNASSRRLHRY